MKYALYEDPVTHRFAFVPLPNLFVDGDALTVASDEWFESHAEAIAALPELLNREERDFEMIVRQTPERRS
jgi:hypothetical protein